MDCQQLPKIGVSEFSAKLREKAGGQRIPLAGDFELTARCNLRCRHCYINRPVRDRIAQGNELTKEQWSGIIDQVVDEGCLWLLITGGEPLIRPDFKNIYEHAKKKGLIITLFTNGTRIDSYIADFLADWRPFSIEITLYGRTERTYESVTGTKGSYARCMKGIELLLDRDLPLALKSTILSRNKHELWEMKSFAESLGVRFRFDPVLIPRLDGKGSVEQFRIAPEEVVSFDQADKERLKGWLDFCVKFHGPLPESDLVFLCGAGINSFHVDSEGRLAPCTMTRTRSYDLRKGVFREGWLTDVAEVISQRIERDVPCRNCPLASICDNCSGWEQLSKAKAGNPIDYVCRIAHLRFDLFTAHSRAVGVRNDRAKRH